MRKMIITSLAMSAVIASVTACTPPELVYRKSLPPSTASTRAINKAKEGVSSQLKDPSSVQFRNVAGYDKGQPGYTMLCGELNAKNSFGGYTGFRHFTYLAGVLVTNELEGNGQWENHFNRNWNTSCIQ